MKPSIFPEEDTEEPDDFATAPPDRRYALMQKLPAGEYWTSMDRQPRQDEANVKDTTISLAQRVAILPSMPPAFLRQPTLGSYESQRRPTQKFKALHTQPRGLSQGSFLDYGPFSSFAPSWDSEGAEVGRNMMGAVIQAFTRRRLLRARQARFQLKARSINVPPASLPSSTSVTDTNPTEFAAVAQSKVADSPLSSLSASSPMSENELGILDDGFPSLLPDDSND